MSEFFLEVFTEEIPAKLQSSARNNLLKLIKKKAALARHVGGQMVIKRHIGKEASIPINVLRSLVPITNCHSLATENQSPKVRISTIFQEKRLPFGTARHSRGGSCHIRKAIVNH